MSKTYPRHPDPALTRDILRDVAQRAAAESDMEHPEDIAHVMSTAIEHAAITLDVLAQRGVDWGDAL